MKNYKKHIDDIIREKAGRSAETPPSQIWEQLNRQLDGLTPSRPPASYRWMRYFAVAALVLLLSVFVVKKIDGNLHPETNNTAAANTAAAQGSPAQQAATAGAAAQSSPAATAMNTNNNENTTTSSATQPGNNGTQPAAAQPGNTSAAIVANNTSNNNNNPEASTTANNNTGKKEKNAYANNATTKNTTPKTKQKQSDTIAANDGAANSKPHHKSRHAAPQPADAHNYGSNPDNINNNNTTALPGNTTTSANTQPATSPGTTANNTTAAPGSQNNNAANNVTNNTAANSQPVKGLFAANKPNQPQPAATPKAVVNKPTAKKHKPMSLPATKWEAGIKVGYESGFNSYAASKAAVSPYLQYNISGKVSLLVQPTAKCAQLTAHSVGNDQSYYQVNDDGTVTQTGATTQQGSNYITNYTYQGTHDSIIKSYAARGNYMEFELPILLKYYLAKKVSVFGGINLLYSKLPGIAQNTYTQNGITKTVDFNTVTPYIPTTLPAAPDVAYAGTSYANYNGPLYQPSAAGQFHIGYMAGFSYEVGRKWLFDALIEQSPVAPNVVGGYNVNAPLSQMYFRLSAGYKFKKSAKKNNPFGHLDTGRGD